jgi:hypothetical protein
MTKRVKRLANSVASRRGFLGRIGWGAMAAAAALGGLLATPGVAHAKKDGDKKSKPWCCEYSNGVYSAQICSPDGCADSHWGIPLVSARRVGSCKQCSEEGWT